MLDIKISNQSQYYRPFTRTLARTHTHTRSHSDLHRYAKIEDKFHPLTQSEWQTSE